MKDWLTPPVKRFLQAVMSLENEEEAAAFFRDICTLSELQEMSKRLAAAEMIADGGSIRQVAEKTGLSTTTVNRVSHWKQHGEGGYDLILSRLSS